MNLLARTRSENRASQPDAGLAQWSVGSIDDDGMRYGLTTYAFTRSTIATAPTIVITQSTTTRIGSGRPRVSRSTGFRECRCGRAAADGAGGPPASSSGPSSGSAGVVGQPGCGWSPSASGNAAGRGTIGSSGRV